MGVTAAESSITATALRLPRAAVTVVAAIVAVAGLTGCTSTANRWAATPQAAAVGFDQSLRDYAKLGTRLKFGCLSGHGTEVFGFISAHGHPRASVTRIGDAWLVTVTYPQPFTTSERYEVRHQGLGYCVSRVLPD